MTVRITGNRHRDVYTLIAKQQGSGIVFEVIEEESGMLMDMGLLVSIEQTERFAHELLTLCKSIREVNKRV
ncbi:hypothetical protein [Bacillus solitudinis]|uniref:hypothetical protein n=1 Tax=Bacillus solitudinis TaxID=2014074 RepID=UPI000C23DDF1|nr:hypothetical protein [Bacillus solitudinis]